MAPSISPTVNSANPVFTSIVAASDILLHSSAESSY
jgi:hypothetical protein